MTPKEQIELKESTVRYKKVGRRYVPITHELDTCGLKQGWYLVKIGDHFTSTKAIVYPDKAEVEAAVRDASDKLVEILQDAFKARTREPLTPQERADWEALDKKHPNIFSYMSYDSLNGMSETIIKGLLGC